MEEKLLDPTLIGVIIGSFLSLIGNVLTQHFSIKKEERQWERQRVSSKEEREEKSKEHEIEHLRELYHNCVLSLSVYMTHAQKNTNEEETTKNIEEIRDIHHWLSLLLLRHPHKRLSQLIDSFLHHPDDYYAEQLRKYVLELVEHEKVLDSPDRIKESLSSDKQQAEKGRTVTFKISDNYRREQMVAGVELPQSHYYSYKFDQIKEAHRDRLLQIYFQTSKKIPQNSQLSLPVHRPGAKQIQYQGKAWEAELNPFTSNVNDVLDIWCKAYDQSLEIAENSLKANA
ncbi:hypothetical protein [Bowmanella dokdonensis]|uniref:Uncharacterized protein n=1 Tax=Bowmanella dokdonensis TaxID=751969 RepID=A0A939IRB2_9ALTE|nr:hypothetical protein [Bowmanella dokdonensis]MBN7827775.1 hypothetical protein [Bowmanella dokdonensis]